VPGSRRRPLREGTIDHFRAYARLLVLDSGDQWEPERFQLDVVDEILKGIPEVWLDVPEGNGKTTLMGGVALYHADYTPDAIVPMAAASRDQTGILLNQAAGFVRRTPGMDRRFRVYEGYRRIDALRTRGRIQVFAADDRTGDGVIFTLALLEELHRHPDLRLYRTWHGKIEKRGGQVVAISTAGEPGGEYENVKAGVLKRGRVRRRGAHTVAGRASSCCTSTRSPPAMTCTTSSASSRPTRSAASPSPGSSASTTARRCSSRTGPGSCAASPPAASSRRSPPPSGSA
jgi:hypothetical protein